MCGGVVKVVLLVFIVVVCVDVIDGMDCRIVFDKMIIDRILYLFDFVFRINLGILFCWVGMFVLVFFYCYVLQRYRMNQVIFVLL